MKSNSLRTKIILITILAVVILSPILMIFAKKIAYNSFTKSLQSKIENPEGRILIRWCGQAMGEKETIARMKLAGQNLNWDIQDAPSRHDNFYFRKLIDDRINKTIDIIKPNFIVSLQDDIAYQPQVKNYLFLVQGEEERYLYSNLETNSYSIKNKNLLLFDGLFPGFMQTEHLEEAVNKFRKYKEFAWFPTVHNMHYPPATPNKLFYTGGPRWDTKRSSEEYTKLFIKLDNSGYFSLCGPKKHWAFMTSSYMGLLPFDGKSVTQTQHDSGISLVLHSKEHIQGGTPTNRIFEAAAANTVIISDKHPFVINNFGDNVLYLNLENKSADEIFTQIDNHVTWIKQNPELAMQKSNNCNKIFLEKFTMEQQLAKLINWHKKHMSKK